MKKKLTALIALLLAATMGLTSCKSIDDANLNETTTTSAPITITKMTQPTTAETTMPTPPPVTTTTTAETTTETPTEPTEATESTETSETADTSAETSSEATSATTAETTVALTDITIALPWKETIVNKSMVLNQTCNSREQAIIGSTVVKEYEEGTVVNVTALTDTGYYKLADGSFIHSDYLDAAGEPAAVTTAASRPAVTTAQTQAVDTSLINTEYNVKYTDRYFWDELTADEQTLYKNIVKAATNYDENRIDCPPSLNSQDKNKVYFIVFNSEPQLFWLDTYANVSPMSISLNFTLSKSEISSVQKEINANVKEIMSVAAQYTNPINKLKIFYDWIILNNDFLLQGTAATCGIENGLRPNSDGIQCNGYAKTMTYLCDLAGIECLTIPGENWEGSTHAWNKVKINNSWYNVDATWGDPYDEQQAGHDYLRNLFFLVPDAWIADTHVLENSKVFNNGDVVKYYDAPKCTKSDLNYYKLFSKEYSDLDTAYAGITAAVKTAVEKGDTVAEIRVTDAEIYETLYSSSYATAIQKYAKGLDTSVDRLSRRQKYNAGVLVVQYNIVYK
ncbi:MAG: hypothetical protein LBM87_03685 [Ruminococcus sp.]|jgi:transglutaminase/protease-like cytokinesis protein 3|nr:hypothetical protein [Ruminococcus sp.]